MALFCRLPSRSPGTGPLRRAAAAASCCKDQRPPSPLRPGLGVAPGWPKLRWLVVAVLVATGQLPAARARAQTLAAVPAAPASYQLVWADEFERTGRPDPANWGFEIGFVRNQEAQWYEPANARCANGLLVIEAKPDSRPNPNYQAGSADWRTSRPTRGYTSASLNTRGKHQWQYGRFELKARIPTSPGLWPAFWTLGVTRPWPSNGEIDIMEYYQDKVLANVASGTARPYVAKWHSTNKTLNAFADPQWTSKFHVWRMDWNSAAVRLYLDDELLNETPLTQTVNQDGSGFNPMQQPHYLLLNLALGGQNGGELLPASLPARYEIDYVRVYQKMK